MTDSRKSIGPENKANPINFFVPASLFGENKSDTNISFFWICQIFWVMPDFLKNPAVEEANHPRGTEKREVVGWAHTSSWFAPPYISHS